MPSKPLFHIVLVAPEIPGNTGSIGRTCLALNLQLHLIHPLGFDLNEKALRRAGLDYWKEVNFREYANWEDFLAYHPFKPDSFYFLSKSANKTLFQESFRPDSYFIFGSETKGLEDFFYRQYKNHFLSLPMIGEQVRSLNLSNAVTAVSYEAYRQLSLH